MVCARHCRTRRKDCVTMSITTSHLQSHDATKFQPRGQQRYCVKSHISKITKKANSVIGFLRRNLSHCPAACRRNDYLSLVRSVIEYGAIVWDPYPQQDIDRLDRVQRVSGSLKATISQGLQVVSQLCLPVRIYLLFFSSSSLLFSSLSEP